jgi:MFS superfamily sulfate permease-like transporter
MPATLPAAFAADLLASLVVFLVALPLCLGIAVASGVPPALGLMTGIVGGIIVGAVQSTPFSVSGPAAGLTVLVLMIVREHGPVFLSAVVLLAGGLQLAAGLLRGGRWFRAVPPAVVHGMLAGIGVLIAAGQAHALVGDQARAGGPATVATLPAALLRALEPDRAGATLAGAATIAVMLAWPRVARGRLRVLPAALLAVVAGTVTAQLVGLPVAHVDVPASLLSAVALPGRETLGHLGSWATWLAAVELALVASAETLLCAAAVDSLHHGRRTDYDRELVAQGLGNGACGLLGVLPLAAVIVRSSTNVAAGARTRLSTVFHGLWLLGLVVLAPGLLRLVPLASLAAVLVVVGVKLVDRAALRELSRVGRSEMAVYAVTLAGVVTIDLLKGVLAGIAVAAVLLLWRLSHLRVDIEHDTATPTSVLHLHGSATFLRLPELAEALESIPSDRRLHVRLDGLVHLDHAAWALIRGWERSRRERGGEVVVDLSDEPPPRARLGRGGPSVGGGGP